MFNTTTYLECKGGESEASEEICSSEGVCVCSWTTERKSGSKRRGVCLRRNHAQSHRIDQPITPPVLMPSKLQGSEMPSSRLIVNKIGVSNAYITLPISSHNLTAEAQ